MSINNKPLEAVTLDDLQGLVDSSARETAVLEFKGDLPVSSIKGSPAVDRWIEKGDRLGEFARDQLLAEMVAFANADGGTLILGIQESKNEPRCAESLAPLPNCEGLAKRLTDAAEDIIEPRMAAISARGLAVDEVGNGYVLLRVGKSLFGPHRLTTTRDFYIRRGERKSRMTAREIRDHSLSLASAGDKVRELFKERLQDATTHFADLLKIEATEKSAAAPFLIRVVAAPMSPQHIDRLTRRPSLWWTGREFSMKIDDQDYPCQYPAREFGHRPDFRLRSLLREHTRLEGGANRLLRHDGLVDFTLLHPWRSLGSDGTKRSRIYFGWIYGLVVGAFAQVRHLQEALAWDAVDFGMQISIFGIAPLEILFQEEWWNSGTEIKEQIPLTLPLYELSASTNLNDLLSDITNDIYNACGRSITIKCDVSSGAIQPVS
jgi:hypothetical protein